MWVLERICRVSRLMRSWQAYRPGQSNAIQGFSSKIHLMPVQKNGGERSAGTGGTGDHTGPAVTAFLCLLLVHVSLNIPLGHELHRKVQDYIRWIKRFVNLEASRVIPGPRFTVVNQRELHGKTINAVIPASA